MLFPKCREVQLTYCKILLVIINYLWDTLVSSLLVYQLVHAPVIKNELSFDRAKAGFDSQTERIVFLPIFSCLPRPTADYLYVDNFACISSLVPKSNTFLSAHNSPTSVMSTPSPSKGLSHASSDENNHLANVYRNTKAHGPLDSAKRSSLSIRAFQYSHAYTHRSGCDQRVKSCELK